MGSFDIYLEVGTAVLGDSSGVGMRERKLSRIRPKCLASRTRWMKMLCPERGLEKESVGIIAEFDSIQ